MDRLRDAANSGKALVERADAAHEVTKSADGGALEHCQAEGMAQPVPFSNIEGATLSGGWRRGTGGQPDGAAGDPTEGREEPSG